MPVFSQKRKENTRLKLLCPRYPCRRCATANSSAFDVVFHFALLLSQTSPGSFFFLMCGLKKKTGAASQPTFFISQQKHFSLYSYDKERGCPGVTRTAACRVAGVHLQGGAPVFDFKVENLSTLIDRRHLESKFAR